MDAYLRLLELRPIDRVPDDMTGVPGDSDGFLCPFSIPALLMPSVLLIARPIRQS